jgi:PmbA protein
VRSTPEDPYWSGFPPIISTLHLVRTCDGKVVIMSEGEYVKPLKYAMEKFKEPSLTRGTERTVITKGEFSLLKLRIIVVNSQGAGRSIDLSSVFVGFSHRTPITFKST